MTAWPWNMLVTFASAALVAPVGFAAEAGRCETYAVIELAFRGPLQSPQDSPARDVELRVTFRHEAGGEHELSGFHDGGSDFKVRFCPTKPGRWELARVASNARQLDGQRQGDHVTATAARNHGFWEIDAESPGQRWYRRSDGSHQFIFGNTQYSFLSGMKDDGPSGNDIATDVAANAGYFKKLRFSLTGDRYTHPTEKPFLDDQGRPTDSGDHSHRPNPKWFRERVDLAVRTAYDHDLIADLILAGPDVEDARAPLRAAANRGDATPYLRYIAARYGSYPNVWICLCNEYDIKRPVWEPAEMAQFGASIREHLPYPTPLSVHASQHPDNGPKKPEAPAWSAKFDALPPWNDHQIIQRKLRSIAAAADVTQRTWQPPDGSPRLKPTVNDELSYQGAGDKHSEGDTLEAHLGAFLGGGYASTGEKRGNKLGHYFWGHFNPDEHSAAKGLKFLRESIDAHVTFWKMSPDASVFPDLDPAFRALAWPDREYCLGTNKAAKIIVELPTGVWTVRQFDAVACQAATLTDKATGRFSVNSPDSRAVLIHFRRNAD
ncbi:MAG TPA: DUF5060 domain-containing protein [Planctomycetaceae bacterium]|nr:DUF5060 domain-containing protein [Planctomycetaceae bacterium]